MRRPGIAIGLPGHRGIFCELLGDVEEVGGMMQGFVQGDAAVDAEQRLVGMKGEGGDA